MEHWWNDVDRAEPKNSGEKLSQVPFDPLQITYGLARV